MERLSAEELLVQYSMGNRNFNNVDLNGAYLFEASLPGINCAGSNLTGVHLPMQT